MEVSGLASEGIANGSYTCVVIWMGPGILSTQREIKCQKQGASNILVQGWMIEGLDQFGRQAASVSLYNNGTKVFEAGCAKK